MLSTWYYRYVLYASPPGVPNRYLFLLDRKVQRLKYLSTASLGPTVPEGVSDSWHLITGTTVQYSLMFLLSGTIEPDFGIGPFNMMDSLRTASNRSLMSLCVMIWVIVTDTR